MRFRVLSHPGMRCHVRPAFVVYVPPKHQRIESTEKNCKEVSVFNVRTVSQDTPALFVYKRAATFPWSYRRIFFTQCRESIATLGMIESGCQDLPSSVVLK